jgi:hypothetical protein
MHIDSSNYGDAKTGVATSDSICGASYTYMLETLIRIFMLSLLMKFQRINSTPRIPKQRHESVQRFTHSSLINQATLTYTNTDTDGSAYLLTEDVLPSLPKFTQIIHTKKRIQRVNGLRIDSLTANYLKPVKTVFLWPDKYTYEAAAILKKGNTYFMFASHQSGWGMFSPIRTPNSEINKLQIQTIISTPQQPTSQVLGPLGSF